MGRTYKQIAPAVTWRIPALTVVTGGRKPSSTLMTTTPMSQMPKRPPDAIASMKGKRISGRVFIGWHPSKHI
jgi:hypothetical protein